MTTTAEPDVLVDRTGTIGHITLNRPKVLNSLDLGMVRRIETALDSFAADRRVAAVVISGAGERGLCAGGDIRALHDSGKAGTDLAETFLREEYRLNARISAFPKPYIAFMDGITMGGGVGVSVHGRHRIVTERTRLAMPETGIGFFPDVGASWLLSRGAGEFGTFLGLTGEQLGAGETIAGGLADAYVPVGRLPGLLQALSLEHPSSHPISSVIATSALPPPDDRFAASRRDIDRLFAFDTVEEIFAALTAEPGDFAERTLATLMMKSPTSLKVTLRLIRLGRSSRDVGQCLEREFAATAAVLESHDFYEGIRAAIIDKDRNPHWVPDSLAAVGDEIVDRYLQPHARPLFAS